MRGRLPCLETSAICMEQLQNLAVANSPLLKEIDSKIEEANQRVEEARAQNKRSIQLSILSPGLQAILGTNSTNANGRPQSIFQRLGSLFSGGSVFTEVIRAIGIPLLQGITRTNTEAQRNAILIGDIQIKIAQLQRDRAELANIIREKVILGLIEFDDSRTKFQETKANALIAVRAFQVYRLTYINGESNTQSYLSERRQVNSIKLSVYSSWAGMRRSLFKLKLIVLAVKDVE